MKKKYVLLLIFACILISGLFVYIFAIQPSYNPSKATISPDNSIKTLETTMIPNSSTESPITKIAFYMSDPDDDFEQVQFIEAKKYAKEKYGAEVISVDGSLDIVDIKKYMLNLDSQGIGMISLHLEELDVVKDEVISLVEKGVVVNTYSSAFQDIGIPVIKSDEDTVSYEMGKQMAEKWKETQPDKPIVMVQFGYPMNYEYTKNRTEPFVQGVLSVDQASKDLGCKDITKGSDAAKLYILDLCEKHPELNLIYIEDSSLTNDILDALKQAGRGQFNNGIPNTEIVCSAGCNPIEIEKIYDENCPLKLSMGLSPIELSHLRIDSLFSIAKSKIDTNKQPQNEITTVSTCISWWTMSKDNAIKWLNSSYYPQ